MKRRAALLLLGLGVLAGSLSADPSETNPLGNRRLYLDPNSDAARQAKEWEKSRPQDAARMRRMAAQPLAKWLAAWSGDVRSTADQSIRKAGSSLPVFVAYNIPFRDCGLHSAGGVRNADGYRRWIVELARGIDNRPAVVILEPDALSNADCLPMRLRAERFSLIHSAVDALNKAGATVYIDAGHPRWHAPAEMAKRLKSGGIGEATGFSLNVSNYHATSLNVSYGNKLSALVGGKHYVIDTSRNGAGTAGKDWCNAAKQALGPAPTTKPGLPLVDAYLWIKVPGQSDGQCAGGPAAGKW